MEDLWTCEETQDAGDPVCENWREKEGHRHPGSPIPTGTVPSVPPKCLSRQEQALLKTALAVVVIKRRWDAKHRRKQQRMLITETRQETTRASTILASWMHCGAAQSGAVPPPATAGRNSQAENTADDFDVNSIAWTSQPRPPQKSSMNLTRTPTIPVLPPIEDESTQHLVEDRSMVQEKQNAQNSFDSMIKMALQQQQNLGYVLGGLLHHLFQTFGSMEKKQLRRGSYEALVRRSFRHYPELSSGIWYQLICIEKHQHANDPSSPWEPGHRPAKIVYWIRQLVLSLWPYQSSLAHACTTGALTDFNEARCHDEDHVDNDDDDDCNNYQTIKFSTEQAVYVVPLLRDLAGRKSTHTQHRVQQEFEDKNNNNDFPGLDSDEQDFEQHDRGDNNCVFVPSQLPEDMYFDILQQQHPAVIGDSSFLRSVQILWLEQYMEG